MYIEYLNGAWVTFHYHCTTCNSTRGICVGVNMMHYCARWLTVILSSLNNFNSATIMVERASGNLPLMFEYLYMSMESHKTTASTHSMSPWWGAIFYNWLEFIKKTMKETFHEQSFRYQKCSVKISTWCATNTGSFSVIQISIELLIFNIPAKLKATTAIETGQYSAKLAEFCQKGKNYARLQFMTLKRVAKLNCCHSPTVGPK